MFGAHDCEVFGTIWYALVLQKFRILVKDGSPASLSGPSNAALSFGFQVLGFALRGFFGGFSGGGAAP